jgi:GTPase Era involved in 16S rRNA processing
VREFERFHSKHSSNIYVRVESSHLRICVLPIPSESSLPTSLEIDPITLSLIDSSKSTIFILNKTDLAESETQIQKIVDYLKTRFGDTLRVFRISLADETGLQELEEGLKMIVEDL